MEQDPDLSGFETLGEFARDGLEPGEDYRVDMAAEGLKFDPDRPVATASGGGVAPRGWPACWRRRPN